MRNGWRILGAAMALTAGTWAAEPGGCVIAPGRVGALRVGMSVEAARRALPGTTWTDADDHGTVGIFRVLRKGVPVFEIFPDQNEMTEVIVIRVLTAECATAEGLRPGAALAGAGQGWGAFLGADRPGPAGREFAHWAKMPGWLAVEAGGKDAPAGEYAGRSRCAARVRGGSEVKALWVSKPGGAPPQFHGEESGCPAGSR